MNRTLTQEAGMTTETLPRDDTVTGLSTIEGIDLDATVACEHSEHRILHPGDAPAAYVVRRRCLHCPANATYLLCKPGWDCMTPIVRCRDCRGEGPKLLMLRIVSVL